MGKSLPRAATTKLQQKLTDHLIKTPKRSKPISQNRLVSLETPRFCCELRRPKSEKKMENNKSSSSSTGGGGAEEQNHRTPLARVVSDCAKRWFQKHPQGCQGQRCVYAGVGGSDVLQRLWRPSRCPEGKNLDDKSF
ncbi:unnamed protein product [Camellia sinensis]